MTSHLGKLTKHDKNVLQEKVCELTDFINDSMFPINDDHLDACVDYIVTKLILYKESNPFDVVKKKHYGNYK